MEFMDDALEVLFKHSSIDFISIDLMKEPAVSITNKFTEKLNICGESLYFNQFVHLCSQQSSEMFLDSIESVKKFEKEVLHEKLMIINSTNDEIWLEIFLSPVIQNGVVVKLIGYFKEISETVKFEEYMRQQTYRDPLTNLFNRTYFYKYLQSKEKGYGVFIDLDGFKAVNDTYGHDAGDFLLMQVAGRIHKVFKTMGTSFRLSGDEFFVFIEDDSIKLNETLELLLEKINKLVSFGGSKFGVSASIGVKTFDKSKSIDAFIKGCDELMYEAKTSGKNQYRIEKENS
jgi:diguanylate cyclase (GGDEF)-like protein